MTKHNSNKYNGYNMTPLQVSILKEKEKKHINDLGLYTNRIVCIRGIDGKWGSSRLATIKGATVGSYGSIRCSLQLENGTNTSAHFPGGIRFVAEREETTADDLNDEYEEGLDNE